MWLNLYGRQAVRRKLKKGLKLPFLCFLAVFELMPDSLTAIYIEPHQFPSHQSILLTQGPICENVLRIGDFENHSFFESAIFIFILFIFLLYSRKNQSKFIW